MLYRQRLGIKPNKRSKESIRKSYEAACKKVGSFAKRRWDAKKFEAFMDGAPIGVTPAEWRYLKLLQEHKKLSTSELSKLSGFKSHSVFCVMRRLVDKCFIKRNGSHSFKVTWELIPWSPHLKLTKN